MSPLFQEGDGAGCGGASVVRIPSVVTDELGGGQADQSARVTVGEVDRSAGSGDSGRAGGNRNAGRDLEGKDKDWLTIDEAGLEDNVNTAAGDPTLWVTGVDAA